jgi:hypothetical protein
MFRLRHDRSRRHFAANETTIVTGVRRLAESLAIEVTETVEAVIPGTLADGIARRRVEAQLAPRIEDAIAGLRAIDDGRQPPMLAEAATIDPKQIATWALPVLAAVLALRWLWPRLAAKAERLIVTPTPVADPAIETHQQRLIADDAAFTRLAAKAERQDNQLMRDALAVIAAQWRIDGPTTPGPADEDA